MSIGIIGVVIIAVPTLLLNYKNARKPIKQSYTVSSRVSISTGIPAGATATGDGSYAIPTNIKNQMEFISPKLGISFLYQGMVDGNNSQHFIVAEIGDKIYRYDPQFENYTTELVPHLEVFAKKPNLDLATAIKQQFLKGVSEKDCWIVSGKTSNEDVGMLTPYPSHFSVAIIRYPNSGNDLLDPRLAKCPSPYTQTSGLEYFLMDNNHPDRFIYIRIGQSGTVFTDKNIYIY